MKKLFILLIALGILLQAGYGQALTQGDPAPDFQAATIGGEHLSYDKDVKGGKPLYLIFWATW